MQLSAQCRPRDLSDFFEKNVGKVADVKMIEDRNSRRSKGVAYIEFVEMDDIPKVTTTHGNLISLSLYL